MIPNFKMFSKKYLRAAPIPIITISSILTLSLMRNAIDISLAEIIAGLGAISLSIIWGTMRASRGYWLYTVYTRRVYESPEKVMQYLEKFKMGGKSIFLYHPFGVSLVTLCAVSLLSCLIWLCGPAYRYNLIALSGIFIMPLLLLFQLKKSIPYHLTHALESHTNSHSIIPSLRRLPGYVAEDLLLSLMINLALVLPIARKPDFSLAEGYSNPAFIVAFMILLSVVLLFMFFFATRSQRYVIFGEMIIGHINKEFAPFMPSLHINKLARSWRLLLWLGLILLWSIIICLIFSSLRITPEFITLYLFGLLPIILIYCVERYQVLYSNFKDAQDMLQRYEMLRTLISQNHPKNMK